MGPPGSGKGTQAARLATHFSIPAISTGDIFRANVAEQTSLGRVAREYMDAGEYVPDHVTNAMVRDRLDQPDCEQGFLLDGYPRTLQQIAELDTILADHAVDLDAVVELVVDAATLVDRLLVRARSQGRVDDTPEVIDRRLAVYVDQTAPLISRYRERNLLHTVAGDAPIDTVTAHVVAALERTLGAAPA